MLSEQIEHHVGEEEQRSKGIFSRARAVGIDMVALGVRLAARKKELGIQFAAEGIPAPETRTFTGGELDLGASVGKSHWERSVKDASGANT